MTLGAAPPSPPWTLGRDFERAHLRSLLGPGEPRWITLSGPPGVGATHLAAAVFHDLPGARAWIHASDLPLALRSAAGLVFVDGLTPDVATARALDEALARVPSLRLLVTSHGPVGGALEHVYPLRPLALPDATDGARSPAFALFERYARAADLRLDVRAPEHLAAAVSLVRALDGIPGLLARAAARLRALDAATLAARVAADAAVLGPARASFDAAVGSLPAAARDALGRLSLCDAPFDLALAEAVCGPGALAALDTLTARALLDVVRDVAGRVRHRPWTPFRPWAVALCAPAASRDAMRRLADHALADPSDVTLLPHLHRVMDLATAPDADDALREHGLQAAVRLAKRTAPLAADLRAALVDLLRRPRGLSAATRARAHLCLGRDARVTASDLTVGRAHLDAAARAARTARDDAAAADVVLEQGLGHHRRRAEAPTRACYERALRMYQALGDAAGEGRALGNLGALDHDFGRFELARERYRAALQRIRAAGDAWLEGAFLGNLGVLEQELGLDAAAERSFRAALVRLEPLGERRLCAITRGNLGTLQHGRGDARAASIQHRQAAEALAQLGDARSEGLAWGRLAAALAALDRRDDAAEAIAKAHGSLARVPDDDATAVVTLLARLTTLLLPPYDVEAAREAARAARRATGDEAALVERNDDARHAVRLLDAALARRPAPADGPPQAELLVALNPRRCRLPNGSWDDLGRHGAMWRILVALAERAVAGERAGLGAGALVALAWPGERILPDAATNRLYVALSGLRARGLRAWILRRDDGYQLDPALHVRVDPG